MPPRRTSQKKDAGAVEGKNEGGSTRRSGRAVVSKAETSAREASRSRRSSTAAQTAVSVADSKTPKTRGSTSRRDRDSASPELSASRSKAARRSTSQVNYTESDGEEEARAPKFDDNFVSGEEFDESESDEKSKPKGRGKAAKSPAKGRGRSKTKASGGRKSRGRPSKKKRDESEEDSEEKETFDISDDSGEVEEVAVKKAKPAPKSSRGRRQVKVVEEEKPKATRRGRASAGKVETPKKRPSRGQAKKYAEEDDAEDVEEVKDDEEVEEGSRKRKRGSSTEEASKRLKEDEEVKEDAKTEDKEAEEEAMEVEESSVSEEKPEAKTDKDDVVDAKVDEVEDKKVSEEVSSPAKKTTDASTKRESTEKVESMDSSNSEPEPKVEKPEDLPETKDDPKPEEKIDDKIPATKASKPVEEATVCENLTPLAPPVVDVAKPEEAEIKSTPEADQEDTKYDSPASDEGKPLTIDETAVSPTPVATTPPKETNQEAVLNGSEKTETPQIPTPEIQKSSNLNSEHTTENSTPTENGAHNDVPRTTNSSDQYFSLPGRKYILNSKLSDSVRQAVKDQTFGFVSYNLGVTSSDAYLQKEKLLNELNSLDARIICLQQVAKPFYAAVLEPSLDALGFKSTFSQPEDSLKGVATFYKSSLFRPTKSTEISLRKLIEKELESTLSQEDRTAVKSHIKKCGSVLFMQFQTVIGSSSFTVANVQIPPTDLSVHALQVSCLAREVVRINGGTSMPLLLGGEFNLSENDASYQLLRDGYLSNDMIEELQKRKDIALPGKENESLVNLLWKSFQHPSSNLCSCYKSVLDHEFSIPETKRTSPDLLWFSSNSLHTLGVLDVALDKPDDRHFSLKADVAFIV